MKRKESRGMEKKEIHVKLNKNKYNYQTKTGRTMTVRSLLRLSNGRHLVKSEGNNVRFSVLANDLRPIPAHGKQMDVYIDVNKPMYKGFGTDEIRKVVSERYDVADDQVELPDLK